MAEKTHDKDVAFIKALAEVLRENDLTELHVKREYGESDWMSVRVAKKLPVAAPVMVHAPAAPTAAVAP
ncbi:MAG: acetyl-CoA carboxylase, biotin carboxyl carrier protein, partial [Roseicyclus sp.]|nr:acetyl-CoA carboxylase, biotin carboxyl carrier protein [Roseicyclus sp.]